MKSWLILTGVTLCLTFCAGGANRFVAYNLWLYDGHLAMEQAQDALEELGVTGKVRDDSGPSVSRQMVAGHIRTEGGTLPFTVLFAGAGEHRVPIMVTLGSKTLLPSPQSSTPHPAHDG